MKLATFYSRVTGRAVMEGSGDDMAAITFGEVDLAFQRAEHYRPPRWPGDEHPKQYHLDFEVADIEAGQRRVITLGATLQKDSIGPEGYGWQVYTDPAAVDLTPRAVSRFLSGFPKTEWAWLFAEALLTCKFWSEEGP